MAVIGVMYNLKKDVKEDIIEEGEPPDSGVEFDSEATIVAVADALKAYGHDVCLIEGNETAYPNLLSGHLDIVFNMCEGLRGESRESHIPAMLEMLGIPYTGSGILALATTLDKPLTKKILKYHGIPTAEFKVFSGPNNIDIEGLKFPLFAKPGHEGSSMGIVPSCKCNDMRDLTAEVIRLVDTYRQPVLVEEYLPGREFTIGIIGNQSPITFPVMEIDFNHVPSHHGHIYSRLFKAEWSEDKYYLCPAPVSKEFEDKLCQVALATYKALDCRDFARVDLRLDREGVPNVLEVNPLPGMAPGYSDYPRIAERAGWSYTELVNGILECALRRLGLSHLSASAFITRQIA